MPQRHRPPQTLYRLPTDPHRDHRELIDPHRHPTETHRGPQRPHRERDREGVDRTNRGVVCYVVLLP